MPTRKTSEITANTERVTRKFDLDLRRKSITNEEVRRARLALSRAMAEIVERINPRGLIQSTDGKKSTTVKTWVEGTILITLGPKKINRTSHTALIIWICGFMYSMSAENLARTINQGPKKKRNANPQQRELTLAGEKMSEKQRRITLAEKACPLTLANKQEILGVHKMLARQGINLIEINPGDYWEWASRLENPPETSVINRIRNRELANVPKGRTNEANEIYQQLARIEK